MFGFSSGSPFTPHAKRGGLHLPSHQMNDLSGLQPELFPNGIEGRTILPRHLNDSVDFLLVEFGLGHAAIRYQVAVIP